MQSEDFDKKIMEAAENHHPAYDEQAWAKMLKLLDKHMPEKEDRRRRFAWLFFLLFIIGGAGIFYGVQSLVSSKRETAGIIKPGNGSVARAGEQPESSMKDEMKNGVATGEIRKPDQVVRTNETINKVQPADNPLRPSFKKEIREGKQLNTSFPPAFNRNKAVRESEPVANQGPLGITTDFQSGIVKKKKKTSALIDVVSKDIPDSNPDRYTVTKDRKGLPDTTAAVPDMLALPPQKSKSADDTVVSAIKVNKADSTSVAALPSPAAGPERTKKKQAVKKQSRFYLTLSAGPDASFTNGGKPGRIIPVTGAGIGYTFRDRFSVRAGFYNAAKVYTASPDAYNAPPNFYNYYPYLVKVDANCRIYEIPVTLGYHFGARKNHSWFASATLSSYLMKRETYNYSYKTSAWGAIQQREWTISNRNEHLFSVLGISGGYQRKISDRISFIAEPYLRMPVNGVGYGKVRLNSAGVMFSLSVQPAAFIPGKQKK